MFYKWCLIGIKRILNNSVFRYFWEVIEVICFNCGGQPTGNLMYFASVPFLWKVSFRRILRTSRIYLMYSLVELFYYIYEVLSEPDGLEGSKRKYFFPFQIYFRLGIKHVLYSFMLFSTINIITYLIYSIILCYMLRIKYTISFMLRKTVFWVLYCHMNGILIILCVVLCT